MKCVFQRVLRVVCLLVLGASFSVWGASGGDALLRLLNSRTAGSPKGYAAAAEEVAEEAAAGHLLQGFVLALVSRERDAPPAARLDDMTRDRYLNAARDKIRALAEDKNNALAWYLLSLENSDTNLLCRAAKLGNAQALNAWGTLSISRVLNTPTPTNEIARTLQESYAHFRQAAGQGDANGLYNLGMCHARGLGVPRDDEKAFTSFRAAAEKGHPEAINSIGYYFRQGRVVPKDDLVATKWFAKSAVYGNAYGQFNCALAFLRGQGVKKDPVRAAKLMKLASEGGCVEAANAYGVMLSRGDEGVKRDVEEAFRLFKRAADLGYPPAMENLSGCYQRGEGVKTNERTALEWKIRSRAAQGDRNAMAWLRKHNLK